MVNADDTRVTYAFALGRDLERRTVYLYSDHPLPSGLQIVLSPMEARDLGGMLADAAAELDPDWRGHA